MTKRFLLLIVVPAWFSAGLLAQSSFTERVDRAFGDDQVLVNGIQFSNQFIRVEGNPYWLDDRFRNGSVCINGFCYEALRLRYNIYSGRIEMEYLTPEGHLNLIMTVAEHLSGFTLEGQEFMRLKFGPGPPAFYQVLSSENWTCCVGWSMDILGGGSSTERFGPPRRTYWMGQGDPDADPDNWIRFHDRKSYLQAVPPSRKKEFKSLLKKRRFSFKMATNGEVVSLVEATLRLLETGEGG
jgi:hypothetical protein